MLVSGSNETALVNQLSIYEYVREQPYSFLADVLKGVILGGVLGYLSVSATLVITMSSSWVSSIEYR